MAKIGVFLADGFEEIEGLTVVDILRRAGVEVTMISIMGRKEIHGAHQITVLADALYEEVSFENLDGVVLPGGMPGTTNLGAHDGVKKQIAVFAEKGKLVAAICAAPSVLGENGILKGSCAFAKYLRIRRSRTGTNVTAWPEPNTGFIKMKRVRTWSGRLRQMRTAGRKR